MTGVPERENIAVAKDRGREQVVGFLWAFFHVCGILYFLGLNVVDDLLIVVRSLLSVGTTELHSYATNCSVRC